MTEVDQLAGKFWFLSVRRVIVHNGDFKRRKTCTDETRTAGGNAGLNITECTRPSKYNRNSYIVIVFENCNCMYAPHLS